jgi:hypothetical protein
LPGLDRDGTRFSGAAALGSDRCQRSYKSGVGVDDMIRLLDRNRIGKQVKIEVLRRGRLREFEVVPSERAAAAA